MTREPTTDDTASIHSAASWQNDVFAIDDAFVPPPAQKLAGTTTTSFGGLLDSSLLLYEDLKGGCGGQLWPAGIVLSRYLLTYHKTDLAGKTIIELGAGGGLVGLAVARSCESTTPVFITDQLPMLALMQKNIELNHLSSKVRAVIYDWGTPIPESIPQILAAKEQRWHPDVVLAADCVYFEPAFPLLLQTLGDLLGPKTVCYFCFKKRRKADWRFIKQMRKQFDVQPLSYRGQEGDQNEGIYLYAVGMKELLP